MRTAARRRRRAREGQPRQARHRARPHRLLRGVAGPRRRTRPLDAAVSDADAAPTHGGRSASLFGGVTIIQRRARAASRNPRAQRGAVTLIPYYLWANRGARRDERVAADRATTRPATSARRAATSSTSIRTSPLTAGAISKPRRSIRAPARSGAASARRSPARAAPRSAPAARTRATCWPRARMPGTAAHLVREPRRSTASAAGSCRRATSWR